MTEIERIHDQIRRSYLGDAWHGPCVKEALEGVTAADAHTRIPGISHTIAELTIHLLASTNILLGRIAGTFGEGVEADYWPPFTDTSDKAWAATLAELDQRHDTLVRAIPRFDPARLDLPVYDGSTPAYNHFLGHAQHNAYHAGQIALLKKLVPLQRR